MAEFTQYITSEGERWDTVAYKAYGDASAFEKIVVANPTVAMFKRLPAGVRLKVPVVERTAVLTDTELLPPWKQ